MILLDTNIISELMRPSPHEMVITWLNNQQSSELFLSSITLAEISFGLYIHPDGKRKEQLQSLFNAFIKKAFSQRILDFDEDSARVYARVMGDSRKVESYEHF